MLLILSINDLNPEFKEKRILTGQIELTKGISHPKTKPTINDFHPHINQIITSCETVIFNDEGGSSYILKTRH